MSTKVIEEKTNVDGNLEREEMDIPVAPSLLACFASGEYTGDGSTSMAVTGVGFLPKYVKIWRRETAANTVAKSYETTVEILDDHANGMSIKQDDAVSGAPESAVNAIISLDADGFTVDDRAVDSDPNASGIIYNYMCIG